MPKTEWVCHVLCDKIVSGRHAQECGYVDTRNILDKYKSWETDLIARDLDSTRSSLLPVFMNVEGDFNLSSGVRNSNWFNTLPPAIAGRKKWDRRGAVGTQLYSDIEYWPADEVILNLRILKNRLDYRVVAAEIDDRAIALHNYAWHKKSVVLFGEESLGLSDEVLNFADDIVMIPGRGSVRSLNVATTCGIFEYDYSMKMGLLDESS